MIYEIQTPVEDGLEFTGTFRSEKTLEDVTCKVKIISERIWYNQSEISSHLSKIDKVGMYYIVEALDGPEVGSQYCCRNSFITNL